MTGTKIAAAMSLGSFTGAVALLEVYGSTPAAAVLAIFGALLAMAEAEGRRWPMRLAVLVFNAVIGTLGAPIIVLAVHVQFGLQHPTILIIASLVVGYLAHDVLDGLKAAFGRAVARVIWGRK